MLLPACPQRSEPERRLNGEVTRLNCEGQFKPFVYLNGGDSGREYLRSLAAITSFTRRPAFAGTANEGRVGQHDPKKSPAFRRDLPALAQFRSELPTALALLVRVLALTVRVLLTVRILLLLSGLLAAALLLAGLLTRVLVLLTRVLVLLARILVLVGHRDLPG